MNEIEKKNRGILTFPISRPGVTPLSNLIDIMLPISNRMCVVTGNAGYDVFKNEKRFHIHGITKKNKSYFFSRVFDYIKTQITISYRLLIIRNIDEWIFFIGGDTLVLPMLMAKLMRKKVILCFAGSSIKTLESSNDSFYKIANILSKINCKFSDKIILYSDKLIEEWEFGDYKNKIMIVHHHFLDFNKFRIESKLDERSDLIGYIGRLSEEKGVMNFVESIPEIIKANPNFKVLIGGEGVLKDKIRDYIEKKDLTNNVTLLGWISDEDMPHYLNKLKLLVLPSYTEGLPYIILEAMACGTPVLTTNVGAIPDIVKDENTGFLMEDNSSMSISKNVFRALKNHSFQKISDNGYSLVVNKFSYNSTLDIWSKIFRN